MSAEPSGHHEPLDALASLGECLDEHSSHFLDQPRDAEEHLSHRIFHALPLAYFVRKGSKCFWAKGFAVDAFHDDIERARSNVITLNKRRFACTYGRIAHESSMFPGH